MRLSLITLLLLIAATVSRGQEAAGALALESEEQRLSYALGMQLGSNFKRDEIALAKEQFIAGVTDAFDGKEPQLSEEQMMATMQAFQTQMEAKMKERMESMAQEMAAAGGEAKTAGAAFLEENGKKEGVKTTESGLQYQVTGEGDGAQPSATDTVTVHYTGTLVDGTVFDSSVERGQPATFPLNGVIAGWTEGLQLIKKGGKARLFIPYDLAYGEQGRPPQIPPYSTLIFDVELLEIGEGS